jgi:glycosyltransferase involved in cell wall biosynthesis
VKLLVVSSKECWPDADGRWMSFGGFPAQMGALARLFDEVTLLIVAGAPRAGGIALPAKARVVPLRRPAGSGLRRKLSVLTRLPYYLGRIRRHVREADVVHVPLPGDIPLLALGVAHGAGKRLLARYGGSWAATDETTLMNRITKFAMKALARRGHVMLATGAGREEPAPGMSWVFATALSQSELDAIVPVEDRVLSEPPRLIYAGRLSAEKGVASLVRAVARLKTEGFRPLPAVTLAGDGSERARLEALVEETGCQGRFDFVGQLTRARLSECFRDADVCVQPSLTEGFSKAWLDAFAHGLPVLSSEVGAARAVLGQDGERGWLVPPGDPRPLADALRRILSVPMDWPALRRRCRLYAAGRTLETWADEIGRVCAQRWGFTRDGGKLREAS